MSRDGSLAEIMSGHMPERYMKNEGTIGLEGQKRLLDSKVAVVGAGGLGGHVIELLARQGIGYLRIIDGDAFARHNLNRQVFATERTIGAGKVTAAAERVAEINPDVQVDQCPVMLEQQNAEKLLAGMDIVVDALDTLGARRLLAECARKLRLPLVHAAIAGFTGQVATILPDEQGGCSLFESRQELDRGIETTLGNPAPTPAIAAALQAQEVVKLITGFGEPLCGKVLYFDLEYNVFEIIRLEV